MFLFLNEDGGTRGQSTLGPTEEDLEYSYQTGAQIFKFEDGDFFEADIDKDRKVEWRLVEMIA